ncbi:ABC transporter permease [Bacillus sonorensis]|uniref:ABC transporter permease n=1 Tax=Bacillus sonorensis TaxID=119858 RepID=UPI000495AD37|nr:ABC transporter permease [Bacillus sonorensis]MCF7619615.1 ABC transporter permease [Bacillus sonorensis]MCZ0069874.1 ABC transporter permease [Bacillus sonorensis]MCZ0097262.1 ABC transporter permease [Bacillus sonorensis]MEC1517941.1 ABC transporter permease [Bacillus sonorensis]MEC1589766.1 ABC transporter permease [Bacillus sonorensis]
MFNLIVNEWIKIFNRKGTYFMIGILLLSVIGLGILTKTIGETDQNADWKKELAQENADMKEQLKGVSNPALEKSYERSTAINEYRIKHDLPEDGNYSALSFISDASDVISFAGLFVITVAAGIVANEFSWGTVKLLVIRPISRFKILLAKYVTVLLFALALLFILFASAGITGLALFGAGDGSQVHLVYANGSVQEKSLLLHLAGSYLLNSISLLMMSTMAFMISAVFRNSSLAVGISIFLLAVGGTVTNLLAVKFDWVKYILFANTDLTEYFDGVPLVSGMTLGFSIAVLAVYFIVFQVLAFGVFTKRDIAS